MGSTVLVFKPHTFALTNYVELLVWEVWVNVWYTIEECRCKCIDTAAGGGGGRELASFP